MALQYNYINYINTTGSMYISSTAGMDYTRIAYGPPITWEAPPPSSATAMKHCALGMKQIYLCVDGYWHTFTKSELQERIRVLSKAKRSHAIESSALDEMIW